MGVSKRLFESKRLKRRAHADVLALGVGDPSALVVVFGGSGIDQEEYEARAHTAVPVFDSLVADMEPIDVTLVYVTAPYDVPFRVFREEPSRARVWNAHVIEELLAPWQSLPFFVAGFSGGAALAFHGVHATLNCLGGATMGGDGLGKSFEAPEHWVDRLQMFVAPDDRVCQHPDNQALMQQLAQREQADIIQLRTGRHRLADYATVDCLGRIIRQAYEQSML